MKYRTRYTENLKRHLWKEKEESTRKKLLSNFFFGMLYLLWVYFLFNYVFHSHYSSPFILTTLCFKLNNGRYVTCPYVSTHANNNNIHVRLTMVSIYFVINLRVIYDNTGLCQSIITSNYWDYITLSSVFTFEVAFESSNVFSHHRYTYRCHIVLHCIIFTLTNLRLYSIQSITESESVNIHNMYLIQQCLPSPSLGFL